MHVGYLNINNIKIFDHPVNLMIDDSQDVDIIFINWVSILSSEKGKRQLEVISAKKNKDKKILIFDSTLSMTTKDLNNIYDHLDSNNVILFEPILRNRPGFLYLPFWIDFKSTADISFSNLKERNMHLVNFIPSNSLLFEYYYEAIANLQTYNVGTFWLPKDKKDYRYIIKLGVNDLRSYLNTIRCSIILDTAFNLSIGYLNPVFIKLLEYNILPIIPMEHKYYHCLFGNSKIGNHSDLMFILKNYDSIYFGLINEIYENIKKYYPEMLTENVRDMILNVVKGV